MNENDVKNIFEIPSGNIDVEALMKKIRDRVEEKKKAGVYEKYNLENISILELDQIKSDQEFLQYYLDVIQRTCDIDIGPFSIINKGGVFGWIAVLAKKIVWHMLKFYTYRMFNQQKEFNCQVVNTIVSINKKIDTGFENINRKLDNLLQGK
jgi:hypothetical protein